MPDLTLTPDLARKARLAGLLYLVIIIAGLGSLSSAASQSASR